MSDKTIDIFFIIFSISTVVISLAELIVLCINKKKKKEGDKKVEKAIKTSMFFSSIFVLVFGFWSSNRKDISFDIYKIKQDSIKTVQNIEIFKLKDTINKNQNELEKEKQKTQSILDENDAYKKYRILLMNQSSYGILYIFLDSTNHYASLNDFLQSNFHTNQFLSNFSYNNVALLGHYVDFTIKPSYESYFDIFEISFFQWYESLYMGNWYVINEKYSTFGGGSTSPIKLEKTIINGKALTKKLSKNKALEYRKNVFETCRIILPPQTTLNIIQTRNFSPYDSTDNYYKTEILLQNYYFTITIKLDCSEAFNLDNKYYIGKLGLEKNIRKEDKIKALEFSVFAKLEIKENIVFSENSAKQFYWANQLLENIKKTFKY